MYVCLWRSGRWREGPFFCYSSLLPQLLGEMSMLTNHLLFHFPIFFFAFFSLHSADGFIPVTGMVFGFEGRRKQRDEMIWSEEQKQIDKAVSYLWWKRARKDIYIEDPKSLWRMFGVLYVDDQRKKEVQICSSTMWWRPKCHHNEYLHWQFENNML